MTKRYISEASLERMREKRAQREKGKQSKWTTKPQEKRTCDKGYGIIYVIGTADHSTPCKIGFTARKDTSSRLAVIQTNCWVDLEVLFESPIVKNVSQVEKRIHSRYNHQRVRNEWFSLTKKQLKILKDQLQNGEFTDEGFERQMKIRVTLELLNQKENEMRV